jgi:hypothetical protein
VLSIKNEGAKKKNQILSISYAKKQKKSSLFHLKWRGADSLLGLTLNNLRLKIGRIKKVKLTSSSEKKTLEPQTLVSPVQAQVSLFASDCLPPPSTTSTRNHGHMPMGSVISSLNQLYIYIYIYIYTHTRERIRFTVPISFILFGFLLGRAKVLWYFNPFFCGIFNPFFFLFFFF